MATHLVKNTQWHWTLVWVVTLALLLLGSAAIAYVLHLLVDKPMLRLRDRIVP